MPLRPLSLRPGWVTALVPPELAGERLDVAAARMFPETSRAAWRRLIDRGSVYLDRQRVRTQSTAVATGVEFIAYTGPIETIAFAGAEAILARGPAWIAFNKPAGMPTIPSKEAAIHCLQAHVARFLEMPVVQVHPVHRLDRVTSGVVLFALDARTAAAISKQFLKRMITKTYDAWVLGHAAPGALTLDAPMSQGNDMGKSAATRVEVLETRELPGLGPCTRVAAQPLTGRFHQIRIHLAGAGFPILGDTRYGGPASTRVWLHARVLEFQSPGAERVRAEAPLPPGWQAAQNER